MRIKSWNLLIFVLVLFMCSVLFVCLESMLGMQTRCVANAYDGSLGDAFIYGGYGTTFEQMLELPYVKAMAGYSKAQRSYHLYREFQSPDVSTLLKYTGNIGITANGYPSATVSTYPGVANMSTIRGVLDYASSYPDYYSYSQPSWDQTTWSTGWPMGGTMLEAGPYYSVKTPVKDWTEFTYFSMKYGHYKMSPAHFTLPVERDYGMMYGGLYGLYGPFDNVIDPWTQSEWSFSETMKYLPSNSPF